MLTLYHRQVAEWIKARFVEQSDWKPHERLAEYFERQVSQLELQQDSLATLEGPAEFGRAANRRKMDELPWHLMHAGRTDRLKDVLTDLPLFLSAIESQKYDWMGYWRWLSDKYMPGVCYEQMVDRVAIRGWNARNVAELMEVIAWFLFEMGIASAAIPFAVRSLAINDNGDENDAWTIANRLRMLAELRRAIGDYENSLRHVEQAITTCARQTRDHALLAACFNTAASTNYQLGMRAEQAPAAASSATRVSHGMPWYHKAVSFHQPALALVQAKKLGDTSPDAVSCLQGLGVVLCAMHDNSAAEPILRKIVAIREQTKGHSHPDTAIALANLALLLSGHGDLKESTRLYLAALAIDDNTLGSDHPSTILTLSNLALLFQISASKGMAGGYMASTSRWFEALRRAYRSLGKQHPHSTLIRKHLTANFRDAIVRMITAIGIQLGATGLVYWSKWMWLFAIPLILVGIVLEVEEFAQWFRRSPLEDE